jgi:hypothetical protein
MKTFTGILDKKKKQFIDQGLEVYLDLNAVQIIQEEKTDSTPLKSTADPADHLEVTS